MKVYDSILKRRSIRKFLQKPISYETLQKLVNAGRLAPSAANLQPLDYVIVSENLENVFPHTKWAGYLEDGSPKEGEEPVAYIVIISDTSINPSPQYDVGLSAENIILTAMEEGIGSCVIGALERENIKENLEIPEKYKVELVIALGYPYQESECYDYDEDVKYWEREGKIHVPKKNLSKISHKEKLVSNRMK